MLGDEVIALIVKERKIKFIDTQFDKEYIKSTGETEEYFIDHSWAIGSDEIVLGIYTDEEKRLASFFHELGHLSVPNSWREKYGYNTFWVENECWRYGFSVAAEYGFKFSHETLEWAAEQLSSYIRYA